MLTRRNLVTAFAAIMLALMLGACQDRATPTPAPLPPTPTPIPPTATPVPPTATQLPPTATLKPPTATPKPPTPTATPMPTETPTPEPPTPTATPDQPRAIANRNMNLRGGPGTNYPVIGSASAGDNFDISGKNEDGSWFQVCCLSNEEIGWLSASLVTVEGEAATIQVAPDIPSPPPTPTAPPQPTSPPSTPPSPATATPESELPPDLGCYLIQNQLNAELTFTIEAVEWNWRETFRIPPGAEIPYCLSPGRYTYTIDAPPPWSNINGTLVVTAGERLYWPIRGR